MVRAVANVVFAELMVTDVSAEGEWSLAKRQRAAMIAV